MINTVTQKSDGTVSQLENTAAITLDAPSVVTLGFGPEEVAKFDKVGFDLVLTLHDGSRVVIANFFCMYDEGRNDIVFVDDNDVVWWGQYDEPWRCWEQLAWHRVWQFASRCWRVRSVYAPQLI